MMERGINQYAVKMSAYYLLLILIVAVIVGVGQESRSCDLTIAGCCCYKSHLTLSCINCGLIELPHVDSMITTNTMTELDVSGNNISEILVGSFEGYDNLEKLRLDHNKLKYLFRGTFLKTQNLEELHVHGNMIFAIQSETFSGLTKLRKLHLGHNRIEYLPDRVFSNMPMLTHLRLQSNKLHDRSFPNSLLTNLTSLEVLKMSDNYLTMLKSNFFEGLNSLKKVSLDNNFLKTVNMQHWPSVAYVHVDLKDNPLVKITNVPENISRFEATLSNLQCTCENERALTLILNSDKYRGIESHCSKLTCISQTDSSLSEVEEIRQKITTPPTSSAGGSNHYSLLCFSVGIIFKCTIL